MKIFIATYGSRGDVQPYVALGKGLQNAGHYVTLATSKRFRTFVEEHDLQYSYMNDDLLAILDTDQGRDLIENTKSLFQAVKRTFSMMRQVGPMQQSLLKDSWDAAKDSNPDLIIFHPKVYGGPHFAEKLGVPVIMALLIPMLVPTAERPNVGFPDLKLGGRYNLLTYRFVNMLMGWSAGKHIKRWRIANGLLPTKKIDILHTSDGKNIPVLHGISKHVFYRPSDWTKSATMTGYWFLNRNDNWVPPTELEAFLEAGPPPIYIGFGSMAGRNPQRLARIVIEALQKSGTRGIIATGWGGLQTEKLPDTILQIDQAPHEWLFPQMAAVVHHGGAGTTAANLRGGKPSIVVPFIGDQPYWGHRVDELGTGSKPIPQKKLTVENLAVAIREVLLDPMIHRRAMVLGEKIRQEDGTKEAVEEVEKLMVDV